LSIGGLLLAGCGSASTGGPTGPLSPYGGSANVLVIASAPLASGPDVVGARLTVSPGIGPAFAPFTVELSSIGGQLGASLSGIPAGPGRQFSVEGYDAQAVVAAQGSTVADVVQGADSRIVIVMNEVPSGGPYLGAPIIDQLAVTQSTAPPLGNVGLQVSAHTTDGSAVTFFWSAACGSFATDPAAASVTWIAPAAAGSCAVDLTATASGGVSVTARISIAVGP